MNERNAGSEPDSSPSTNAELEIRAEPDRPSLKVSLPATCAGDLLPITAIVGCAVVPALTLWAGSLAKAPSWVLIIGMALAISAMAVLGTRCGPKRPEGLS